MASYVIELSTASNDLADWKHIPLTVDDAAYCMANGGHMAFEISGFCPSDSQVYEIAVAWADCDESANNAIIGVSKIQTFSIESSATANGPTSNFVVQFFTPTDRFVETYGLGPSIDQRTPSVANRKRLAFIGLTNDMGSLLPLTLVLTPTKIV